MFLAHGEWKISVKNNYVLQWVGGNWNEEAAIEYRKEFENKTNALTNTLNNDTWAVISCLDDWGLATPEAEVHLIEHLQGLKDLGCTKHCHIFMPSVVKSMQLDRVYSENNINYERKIFENKEPATAWLKSNGFLVEVDELMLTEY